MNEAEPQRIVSMGAYNEESDRRLLPSMILEGEDYIARLRMSIDPKWYAADYLVRIAEVDYPPEDTRIPLVPKFVKVTFLPLSPDCQVMDKPILDSGGSYALDDEGAMRRRRRFLPHFLNGQQGYFKHNTEGGDLELERLIQLDGPRRKPLRLIPV